ncbi:MAG: multicopper oxidase domain-containing protein [Deltaproteobacteria bacterium]|nr:multicopper oxidase domain-containing protein [Deltaproteobacteria bacterium]
MKFNFVIVVALLVPACASPSEQVEVPAVCATPDDATAPADIEVHARDVAIEPVPGRQHMAWTYDGDVPGPVIRMNVGETRRVRLVNDSPRAVSMHFHGVVYDATDDGTPEHPESMVNPGCAHVYTITATLPGVWPYHSHRDPRGEMAMGLYGAVVVPAPDETPAEHDLVVFLGQLGIENEEAEESEEEEEE